MAGEYRTGPAFTLHTAAKALPKEERNKEGDLAMSNHLLLKPRLGPVSGKGPRNTLLL